MQLGSALLALALAGCSSDGVAATPEWIPEGSTGGTTSGDTTTSDVPGSTDEDSSATADPSGTDDGQPPEQWDWCLYEVLADA